jgi:hypothetical protein
MLVDDLVRAYRNAPDNRGGSETRNEILAELYDLHARGLVLWPLGVQWNRSVLGEVTSYRFSHLVEEEDPSALEYREQIERSPSFVHADYARRKKDVGYRLWRLFMTLKLANIGLYGIDLVREEHLFTLFEAMHTDGLWSDWVSDSIKGHVLLFGRFLATHHDDPMLGVGFLNPKRRTKLAPGVPSLLADNPHLQWLYRAFEVWLDQNVSLTKKSHRQTLRLLSEFLSTLPHEQAVPDELFSRSIVKSLFMFATDWSTPATRGFAISKILDFAEWFCHDYCVDQGIKPRFELTRNDIDRFLKAIPPAPARHAEVVARPMPMRFHLMLKRIITENDFAWPKSLTHGQTGRPIHWIPWTDPNTGNVRSVFCEVLPRMLLLQLELPLRNVQARRLDSGEGDDREYDPISKAWRDARGPVAGYWRALGVKNPRRGVFREIVTETGTIAGFWINSNKTKDSGNLFDETSGYEIPWQHDEVLENLAAMRRWQELYNPVSEPLAHADVPQGVFREEPSRAVRAVLPARFYLFRHPQNIGRRGREAPARYTAFLNFFLDALNELENRLREEDPESDIQIITERDAAGQPRRAIFTAHGMRSSTLTSLHREGVPIGILSKVVAGHATILMTLRYTKFDPAHVTEVLNNAYSQAMLNERGQFANFLKSATVERAMRMTARLADDGLQQIKGIYEQPACWSRLDIGICPNGGTQCHIGGEPVHKRKEKNGLDRSSYGVVPGGPRNCVRCRFFVTGLPFLLALCAHATAILAKIDSISKRITSVEVESEGLKRERRALGHASPRSLLDRIRILDETFVSESEMRDQALADVHATMVLVEKVRAIAFSGDDAGEAKLPMLLNSDVIPDISFRESTRFELVDAVVQASRWFPSINSVELEAERDDFLNRVLYRNGYVPITLSPLTPSEKRKAADALAQMLLVELGATEAQRLLEGRTTLIDLGLQEKLERAAAAATGRPLERLIVASRAIVPAIEPVTE